MPKMRTIDQAHAWLQQSDPETAATRTALRRMIKAGEIPSVRVGQKYLVALEQLEECLLGKEPVHNIAEGIREVPRIVRQ